MGLKTVVFDALKPMPKVQFKEVITGPAIRASLSGRQLEIKPDLVQQLLDDCDQGGDTLPLLSLTLARLYREYGSEGDLSLAKYQDMGGMANVIRTEIESILDTDPEKRKAELEILHAAFIPWLATINPDNDQPMRRLARMSDLPPASHRLVQALIEKRLLLSDMRDGEQVMEVAHESLLRQWETLATWLREEREDLKEADRLEQAVAAWNRSGRKADWLMEGERLSISEALAAKPGYRQRLESAAEFLLCSRQRETERKEEEERQRQAELDAAQEKQRAAQEREKAAQEKQAAAEALAAEQSRAAERAQADSIRLKRRAKQLLGAAFVAVLLTVAAGYGFYNAEAEKERALVAQRQAQESNRKAQSALAQADFREAQRHYKDNKVPHALAHLAHAARLDPEWVASRSLLVNLLQQRSWFLPVAIFKHRAGVQFAQFSPDGTRVVTASDDNTARLWDAKSGKPLGEAMEHKDRVWSAQFSPDGTRVVTASEDNTARLWDAQSGKPLGEAMEHQGVCHGPPSSVPTAPGW